MDYFWLLAAVSASFGALLTGAVLRRLDTSRMSYREAKQLLSAMVTSLSGRIQRNELLARELSDQVQMLTANQARLRTEVDIADKQRLLEYMQDWMTNMRGFVNRLDKLQKNLKDLNQQFQKLSLQVEQHAHSARIGANADTAPVGVVTEHTLTKLTPTERKVLELLMSGPKAGPEIGRVMMKSREHTARLMKSLFEEGFVGRETGRQPYEYRLSDKVREGMAQTIEERATGSTH